MVWEKCVAIMSNDDVDEGKALSDVALLSYLLFPHSPVKYTCIVISSSKDGLSIDL